MMIFIDLYKFERQLTHVRFGEEFLLVIPMTCICYHVGKMHRHEGKIILCNVVFGCIWDDWF